MGYIYSQQTLGFLQYWQQQSTQQDWIGAIDEHHEVQAISGARRAIEQSPENPVLLGQLAKVYSWQTYSEHISHLPVSRDALPVYRQLIRMRPAWPYYRAEFAMAKARTGEIDREFEKAVNEALRLGSWEKEVLQTIATLGWLYHPWLSPQTQRKIDQNLSRFVSAYPWDAIHWGQQQGNLKQLCQRFDSLNRYSACKQYLNH